MVNLNDTVNSACKEVFANNLWISRFHHHFLSWYIGLCKSPFTFAFVNFKYLLQGWANSALRCKLSLWNAISCPCSRQLSLVTFKGDYAILALRNYKMQAEKRYSYLTIAKLLTTFRSMKHSRDSLEMQFLVYKTVTATLLHYMHFRWNGVPLSCIWHSIYTALRVAIVQ